MALKLALDHSSHFFATSRSPVGVSVTVMLCFGPYRVLFTPPCRWLISSQSAAADVVWWWEGKGYVRVKANLSPYGLYRARNNPLIFPASLVEEIPFTHSLCHRFPTGDSCVCSSRWPHCSERVQVLWLLQCCCRSAVFLKRQCQPLVSRVSFLLPTGSTQALLVLSFFWLMPFFFFFFKQMKKHPCRQCDKSFSSSHSLCRHNRIKHKGIRKVYTCS